jgi:hypothetical protein
MEELIQRMKKMNLDCNGIIKEISSQGELVSQLVITIFSMRDAINEMATEIILLKEEVERNGKGEI